MKRSVNRREALVRFGAALAGLILLPGGPKARAATHKPYLSALVPKDFDPMKHKWLMVIDVDRCIGCGLCVEACKTENHVPRGSSYFRTWIERYIIKRPEPKSGETRGEVVVDSPNGGIEGFPPSPIPAEEIQEAFFVPKLCNLCEHSPCSQVCPVGATFDTPDGAVLVDANYCIGCGFCIQACPYGCRFLHPVTKCAEKCTLCYHRIHRGLKPACVEICPSQARIFGDVMNPLPDDPIMRFFERKKTQALKSHLGTDPRLLYAGLDKEVR